MRFSGVAADVTARGTVSTVSPTGVLETVETVRDVSGSPPPR